MCLILSIFTKRKSNMLKDIDSQFYKFLLLLLLLLPLQIVSFELTFAVLSLLTVFFLNRRRQKISGDFITSILFLLIIFGIGLISTFFYHYQLWDIGKDIAYFLKPVLILFLGYTIIYAIKNQVFFFKAFVYMGIAFAFNHFFKLITFPDLFNTSINTIRTQTGLSNHVELLAMVFLLLSFKYPKIQIFDQKKITYLVLAILTVSFILYFSRTMWVAIFLLLFGAMGYAKISLKAIKYIGLAALLIGSFYIYLYSIEIPRDEPGVSAFLYKMKIAPEEIFTPKIDLNNHVALWDHWRAYEAKMAFDQTHGYQHLVGRGLGSLVDLHFVAPLNDEGMRYISHLHNGYAMIYYKTGILGLVFYLLFLLNLYLFAFYKKHANPDIPITNLIAGIGIYFFFSSLIITGVYNLSDIYLLALGGLYTQYDRHKNAIIEYRLTNQE